MSSSSILVTIVSEWWKDLYALKLGPSAHALKLEVKMLILLGGV